jgi:predicted RNA-binding protein with PIN domain
MPVLIDGNNLLFAAREADPERPPSRSTLCLRLGQWARRTGEKVAIVFDGPTPTASLARQIGDPDVAVNYSGAGISADKVLTEAIEADSAARLLLVVSSDREIGRAARRRKAKTMRSDVFWATVQRDLARSKRRPAEPPEKRRGLRPGEAARWLSELGLDNGQPHAGSGDD